jgi:hypothetical protein
MAPVPARASAHHPQNYGLPPRLIGMASVALLSTFIAGLLSGMLVGPPSTVERCGSASDPIGCLILSLD